MNEPVRHLYIHVPFCPTKCSYCAFVTHVGSLKLVPAYVESLRLDITRQQAERLPAPLDTVYFGGGTPSLLTPPQIESVLDAVGETFGLREDAEVTLEAHPSTVDQPVLRGFRSAGVTRVSFGGESFNRAELRAVGREQDAGAVARAVTWSRAAGFDSIALDFMYGLPLQTAKSWRRTLDAAVATGVDHLSLYPLSVESGTVFARRQREGRLRLPSDGAVAEMYTAACDVLRGHGYGHYEVSNWARPGHECRHNLAYWRNREFYAVGVGAHGYLKPHRTERVRRTSRYIDLVSAGLDPVERRETIDTTIEDAETVMLGLRLLQDGVDMRDLAANSGHDLRTSRREALDELSANGLIRLTGDRVMLAEEAVPVANEVWQRLM